MKEAVLPDYTVREAAVILRCTVKLIYTLIKTGCLKAYRLGRCSIRVKREELERFRDEKI